MKNNRCFECVYRKIYHEEAMIYFCHKIKDFVETGQAACENFVERNTEDDFLEGL